MHAVLALAGASWRVRTADTLVRRLHTTAGQGRAGPGLAGLAGLADLAGLATWLGSNHLPSLVLPFAGLVWSQDQTLRPVQFLGSTLGALSGATRYRSIYAEERPH
ncbi:MAG: hypothetical protein ACI8S6_004456 [Myxococcota bacterium]|jgi:hypothetical protein